jgi:biotin transport system substrate-specific component
MGVPWFAGFNSGIIYLTGPTGGYIIGFILAAFFTGYMVDKYIQSRKFTGMFALMLFSTFVLIYIPGLIQFYLWTGASIGIWELLTLCVFPFIAIDIIKSIIAAGIATSITPKKAYGGEIDTLK